MTATQIGPASADGSRDGTPAPGAAPLSPSGLRRLRATLRQLAAEGRTLVVATHDEEFARSCAHRVLIMEEGRVAR